MAVCPTPNSHPRPRPRPTLLGLEFAPLIQRKLNRCSSTMRRPLCHTRLPRVQAQHADDLVHCAYALGRE